MWQKGLSNVCFFTFRTAKQTLFSWQNNLESWIPTLSDYLCLWSLPYTGYTLEFPWKMSSWSKRWPSRPQTLLHRVVGSARPLGCQWLGLASCRTLLQVMQYCSLLFLHWSLTRVTNHAYMADHVLTHTSIKELGQCHVLSKSSANISLWLTI